MITMLSDFGYKDAYVAVMKGVIASIVPLELTCDLTHAIHPQDILAARFNLMMAYSHFPRGTVHLAVVDPGVGTTRRAVAIKYAGGFLVGPDNGLLSGVVSQEREIAAVALTNPEYWRVPQPSCTFHGRDIFAPVAAHLAKGVDIDSLGDRIDAKTLVTLDIPSFTDCSDGLSGHSSGHSSGYWSGSVQYIDGFGNCITNIPQQALPVENYGAEISALVFSQALSRDGQWHDLRCVKTYADIPGNEVAVLMGSHGWVEIACNGSSAAEQLGVIVGAQVRVGISPESQ